MRKKKNNETAATPTSRMNQKLLSKLQKAESEIERLQRTVKKERQSKQRILQTHKKYKVASENYEMFLKVRKLLFLLIRCNNLVSIKIYVITYRMLEKEKPVCIWENFQQYVCGKAKGWLVGSGKTYGRTSASPKEGWPD